MIIIVSGFAGSGKSTLAEKLAAQHALKCVHASGLLRQLQERAVHQLQASEAKANTGWWESPAGKAYLEKRMKDPSMDKALDAELQKIAAAGDVVLDSWTMPWLFKGNAFKVWLRASAETRAKRVSGRDKLDEKEVYKKLKERDEKTAAIYKKIYGFDLGKDLRPFTLVLDTDTLNEEQVFAHANQEIIKWKEIFGEINSEESVKAFYSSCIAAAVIRSRQQPTKQDLAHLVKALTTHLANSGVIQDKLQNVPQPADDKLREFIKELKRLGREIQKVDAAIIQIILKRLIKIIANVAESSVNEVLKKSMGRMYASEKDALSQAFSSNAKKILGDPWLKNALEFIGDDFPKILTLAGEKSRLKAQLSNQPYPQKPVRVSASHRAREHKRRPPRRR